MIWSFWSIGFNVTRPKSWCQPGNEPRSPKDHFFTVKNHIQNISCSIFAVFSMTINFLGNGSAANWPKWMISASFRGLGPDVYQYQKTFKDLGYLMNTQKYSLYRVIFKEWTPLTYYSILEGSLFFKSL